MIDRRVANSDGIEKKGVSFIYNGEKGERLDIALLHLLSSQDLVFSRAQLKVCIQQGLIKVNDVAAPKAGLSLSPGDSLAFTFPPSASDEGKSKAYVPFGLVYEDDHLLIIDKPKGVVVHPGAGTRNTPTLIEGLRFYFGENSPELFQGEGVRPGLIHRLDKDTSGLMVIGKTKKAFSFLQHQIADRLIQRRYLALVESSPRHRSLFGTKDEGVIDLPIGRDPKSRVKMAVLPEGGRNARTFWRVLFRGECGILLECALETGRTHQIRVHCCAQHAPLVGDSVYSQGLGLPIQLRSLAQAYQGQALHAWSLALEHPETREKVEFKREPRKDLQDLIKAFLGCSWKDAYDSSGPWNLSS